MAGRFTCFVRVLPIVCTVFLVAVFTSENYSTLHAEPTIRLRIGEQLLVGKPVAWSDDGVLLMGRDGQLSNFHSSQASQFEKVNDSFRSLSQSAMRGQLLREFGERFDVSGTGHYLVVHPRGEKDLWAQRFEQLYRQFVHYFSARGFRPQTPEFPLVAVVFHNRNDFVRFATIDGVNISGSTLGYYSPKTNRVMLFDTTAGQTSTRNWTANADTIIHEATHQTAFNTGIHTRLAAQPKWAAEGLATMFEAPGVWDSATHRQQSDRINTYRLERFQHYAASRRKRGAMERIISSDRMFQSDADGAYAEAWALTFYLAEREPAKYARMLAKLARRPAMQPYSSARRLQDFRSIFGNDVGMLEIRMLRYINSLHVAK